MSLASSVRKGTELLSRVQQGCFAPSAQLMLQKIASFHQPRSGSLRWAVQSCVAPPAWGLSARACWGMTAVLAAAFYTIHSRGSHWIFWGFLYASVAFLSYSTDLELGEGISAWFSACYVLESASSRSGYLDDAAQRRMPRFIHAICYVGPNGQW